MGNKISHKQTIDGLKNPSSKKETEEEVEEEFNCTICLDIFYQPVTTECGHTFCKQCLQDALTIRHLCTICRAPIFKDSLSNLSSMPVNITL